MKLYEIADPTLAKGMSRRIMRDYDVESKYNTNDINFVEEFKKLGLDANRLGNKKLKKILKEIIFKKVKNRLIDIEDKGKYGIYTLLIQDNKNNAILPTKVRFNYHPQLLINRGHFEENIHIPVYIHFHALEQTFHRHTDKTHILQIKNTFGPLLKSLIKPNIFTKVLNFLKAQPRKRGIITLPNGLITIWEGEKESIICVTVLKEAWKDQTMPPEIKI